MIEMVNTIYMSRKTIKEFGIKMGMKVLVMNVGDKLVQFLAIKNMSKDSKVYEMDVVAFGKSFKMREKNTDESLMKIMNGFNESTKAVRRGSVSNGTGNIETAVVVEEPVVVVEEPKVEVVKETEVAPVVEAETPVVEPSVTEEAPKVEEVKEAKPKKAKK
jgi:hypothetical protein